MTLGDAAALNLSVDAAEIALILRNSGVTVLPDGATTQDGGSWILARVVQSLWKHFTCVLKSAPGTWSVASRRQMMVHQH